MFRKYELPTDCPQRARITCANCSHAFFGDPARDVLCPYCRRRDTDPTAELRHLEPTTEQVMRKYPSLVAHIICASLGYATPTCAARILRDYILGLPNYCEWIAACHKADPAGAVRLAWLGRHRHRGFMADYPQALALVMRKLSTGDEPMLASWF